MSNVLIELNEHYYNILQSINKNAKIKPIEDVSFFEFLIKHKIIIKEWDEILYLEKHQYQKNALSFDNSSLNLTICPTLSCNFCCEYCFESHIKEKISMNKRTIEQITKFVEKFTNSKYLSITWYGGEPLLEIEIIEEITQNLRQSNLILKPASIVTNGYLMDSNVIEKLIDLQINSIQITIDGNEECHNERRKHITGVSTYSKILKNVEELLQSEFNGICNIRVNIDKSNYEDYFKIHNELTNHFNDERINVYAGKLEILDSYNTQIDKHLTLGADEWIDFSINNYLCGLKGFDTDIFPKNNTCHLCTANTHNAFVIGPEGELYKCWEDVGDKKMIVGSIFDSDIITNPDLIALYNVGTDQYNNTECRKCFYLPICSGGCSNRRLRVKYFNESDISYCSLFKGNLEIFLREYYHRFIENEICSGLLSNAEENINSIGYRVIANNKIDC